MFFFVYAENTTVKSDFIATWILMVLYTDLVWERVFLHQTLDKVTYTTAF